MEGGEKEMDSIYVGMTAPEVVAVLVRETRQSRGCGSGFVGICRQ